MSEVRKYSAGRWYSCRHRQDGTYYVFWSENRRSRRKSTGTTSLVAALAFLDEGLTLEGMAPEDLTCEDLFRLKYPEKQNERADAA